MKNKKNKLLSFKLVDRNGNVLSLIMVAVAIIFVLSSVSIVLGVKSLLSVEKSSILDFGNALFIDNGLIKDEIVVETGSELPELKDYFVNEDEILETTTIRYFDAVQIVDVNDFTEVKDNKRYVLGVQEFYVLIFHDGVEYESILRIVDNVKPVVIFKDVEVNLNDEVNGNSFIDSYNDNSLSNEYSVTIKNSVSTKEVGTFDVNIEVCDLGGNCVRDNAKLVVKEAIENVINNDNVPPTEEIVSNTNNKSENKGNEDKKDVPVVSENTNNKDNKEDVDKNLVNNNNNNNNNDNENDEPQQVPEFNSYEEYVQYMNSYFNSKDYIIAIKNTAQNYYNLFTQDQLDAQAVFLGKTNEVRLENEKDSLVLDDTLNKMALARLAEVVLCQDGFVDKDFYGNIYEHIHVRPNGERYFNFFYLYGYYTNQIAENAIFISSMPDPTNEEAIYSLIASEGHKKNILGNYTKMGVAVLYRDSVYYWLQIFE